MKIKGIPFNDLDLDFFWDHDPEQHSRDLAVDRTSCVELMSAVLTFKP